MTLPPQSNIFSDLRILRFGVFVKIERVGKIRIRGLNFQELELGSRVVQNIFFLESVSRVGSDFFLKSWRESGLTRKESERVGFDPNLESYILKYFFMNFLN